MATRDWTAKEQENTQSRPEWVYLWPDGTWCEPHELEQMTHMSDDFCKVVVYYEEDGSMIFGENM